VRISESWEVSEHSNSSLFSVIGIYRWMTFFYDSDSPKKVILCGNHLSTQTKRHISRRCKRKIYLFSYPSALRTVEALSPNRRSKMDLPGTRKNWVVRDTVRRSSGSYCSKNARWDNSGITCGRGEFKWQWQWQWMIIIIVIIIIDVFRWII
jgi:hypothetical protein